MPSFFRSCFYVVLCLAGGNAGAQSALLETISIEQGLSQGFVTTILQDSDGFMWFGTANGLNRYDGYEFLVFKNDPYNPHSIADNEILSVTEAGEFLVIRTKNQGINLLDRATRLFYRLPYVDLLKGNQSGILIPEGKGTFLCLGTEGAHQNLYRIILPPNLAEQLRKGVAVEQLVRLDTVIRQTDINDLVVSYDHLKQWIIGDSILWVNDLTTSILTPISLPDQMRNFLRAEPDSANGVWLFRPDLLAHFDGQHWQSYSIALPSCILLHLQKPGYILWLRSGADVYGFDTRHLPEVLQPQTARYHLNIPEIAISNWTDTYGNVWFGTDAKGIRKFNPRNSAFQNYLQGYSIYCPPLADKEGRVWLGDVRRGQPISGLLDLKSGNLKPLQALGLPLQSNINRIVSDESGNYWIGSVGAAGQNPALIRYNPGSGQKEVLHLPASFDNAIFAMRFVPPGRIWMANAHQLLRFEVASRQFTLFESPQRTDGYQGAYSMETSPDGVWWIATENGLLKAVPGAGNRFDFTILQNSLSDRNSLPGNQIKSLLADPDHPEILWIGTRDQGLCRLNIRTNTFTKFTTRNGLSDDTVYGILAEDVPPEKATQAGRNLWLSTNKGLTCFNPLSGQFQYYFKADGLQDNEFNTYAYGKSSNGALLFGGVNGLTIFDPKNLIINQNQSRAQITGLKINGRSVDPRDTSSVLDKSIEFTRIIRLAYNQNNLNLQFASTDFTQPERNRFAFYLEGAEPEWAHTGFEHTAQYLHLAPGTYTFRVKTANSDGVWNERPTALQILILPPWYLTAWAYLAYLFLITGGVYAFYRIQLNRKLEQLETRRLKDLDAFKSRFFTNISHEFRTPLTVILGMTQQLMSKPVQVQDRLPLVHRNAENLLRLVNQILDLAKLESNSLKMDYVQGDVLAYLRYIVESLQSMANMQNVLLEFGSTSAAIVMDHDPDRLMQIVHNLLSNAIKFTPSGGRVRMRAEVKDDKFVMTVSDNGAGIPPEELPNIFDRFFQAKNQEHARAGGTGIGLSLTFELVKAMGGQISVESQPGRGTDFTVTLPISRNALPAESSLFPHSETTTVSVENTATGFDPETAEKPLVLLLEDNADVLQYLRDCLAPIYRLDFAYNGRAGIEKALETIPDLIVSDVMMPEKDGFEVCEALKNDERTSHVPIVLLTAKATVKDRIAGLSRGADAYLSKPFHPEELLVTLSKLIELRQKLRARYATAEPLPLSGDKEEALEDAFLQKIRAAVESRLDDASLSVDDICRMLGMSHSVIHRKLAALTGRSLTLYVRSIRLQKARELLIDPALSISEVAFATGFNDPKFFSRVFAETYGVSPSVYRQKSV